MALLLFLICAMAASVVLTAGTAAAGRASELPESDQAYYSVTSAVNLLRDQLLGTDGEGHAVTVAVRATGVGSSTPSYQVTVNTDGVAAGTSYTLLERAAVCLLFGSNGEVSDEADAQTAAAKYFTKHSWNGWASQVGFSAGTVEEFDLTHNAAGLDSAQQQELALKGEASIDNDGDLVFTLRKPGGADEGDIAVFNMTCETDIESGEVAPSEPDSNVEVKYVTVTWKPTAVEKG